MSITAVMTIMRMGKITDSQINLHFDNKFTLFIFFLFICGHGLAYRIRLHSAGTHFRYDYIFCMNKH